MAVIAGVFVLSAKARQAAYSDQSDPLSALQSDPPELSDFLG